MNWMPSLRTFLRVDVETATCDDSGNEQPTIKYLELLSIMESYVGIVLRMLEAIYLHSFEGSL